MTEFTEITTHSYKQQERHAWYRVNAFLSELGGVESELQMQPNDLVHIGGAAIFYHSYKALGPLAVPNFRGTHDLDIISFRRGSLQRALEQLAGDPRSMLRDFEISSSHIPDKRTVHLRFKKNRGSNSLSALDIDFFESHRDQVNLNDRRVSKNRIVLDPPEQLELPTFNPQRDRGLVGVPSLRDTFIIKMDIVDFSKLGLRSKDRIDVLTIFALCKALGHDYDYLLNAMSQVSSFRSTMAKLKELERLFSDNREETEIMGKTNPLLPSKEQIGEALRVTRDEIEIMRGDKPSSSSYQI
ncbi:hypothetical protein A2W45_02740 [Candidatus Curtissbacteria bacterium RIFCSPHIGHO2_12_41_11]|uniref:Nucleotidyl transferase AbiEii/AbiGii toxin family protein n=2 Tax=Candidatus Curtissiibacteriota TaxID=1752717 RepID=A0A1F5H537_9BACT|nr:MAG: hypothetical protein A3D07_03230 [Candidatus Curtissbacteria bacterium RIFCSPHIGHO2_02_FULL_42_15]OGD99164.1 MAG: hypothetical protein A2W45_02740 [Candidatus Curtissbacteria bacterium RIFCSPHIGHO2_12_41_11]